MNNNEQDRSPVPNSAEDLGASIKAINALVVAVIVPVLLFVLSEDTTMWLSVPILVACYAFAIFLAFGPTVRAIQAASEQWKDIIGRQRN